MEQIKAMNALEPFLALTKSASSPLAAADLITRATSAPNTFIFAELLAAPNIQALQSSEKHAGHLSLLKIFSYGTYRDYKSASDLPTINAAQTLKLRQLSLLTLAKTPSSLSYDKLLNELGLETTRELEDLVVSAIYAGLISAQLDPYHQLVAISSVAPLRDLQPNSIPFMLSTLDAWSVRCTSTLQDLEAQIATIKSQALLRHKEEAEWSDRVEKLLDPNNKSGDDFLPFENQNQHEGRSTGGYSLRNLTKKLGMGAASKRGNSGGVVDDDDMDVDNEDQDYNNESKKQESRAKKSKGKGGMSLGGFGMNRS